MMNSQTGEKTNVAILHYSVPPVIGGVEAVIEAHVRVLLQGGYRVRVLAGRGEQTALPEGAELVVVPQMDTQYPAVLAANALFARGKIPQDFEAMKEIIAAEIRPYLADIEVVIVHNIFGKHFNLPLTAALVELRASAPDQNWIAWGHDFTWTSPSSRSKVHPGYPWDLLRTYREDITYVAVSEQRREELAGLYDVDPQVIRVVYNGVDPTALLGLSPRGEALVRSLGLMESELNLLMPVRVTTAKNIEFALRVAAALKAAGIQFRMVLTGPPDPHDEKSMAYYQSLRDLRSELGITDAMRFVFETPLGDGTGQTQEREQTEGTLIDMEVVGELYRASDILFMPSHREGFGMPVLEAGLAGVAVFSSEAVPAAREIGLPQVVCFATDERPEKVAERIRNWMESDPVYQLRRKVRNTYTWQALFEKKIEPLL